jgi:hypothetical protein
MIEGSGSGRPKMDPTDPDPDPQHLVKSSELPDSAGSEDMCSEAGSSVV